MTTSELKQKLETTALGASGVNWNGWIIRKEGEEFSLYRGGIHHGYFETADELISQIEA